jgi:hypothetical protein
VCDPLVGRLHCVRAERSGSCYVIVCCCVVFFLCFCAAFVLFWC